MWFVIHLCCLGVVIIGSLYFELCTEADVISGEESVVGWRASSWILVTVLKQSLQCKGTWTMKVHAMYMMV